MIRQAEYKDGDVVFHLVEDFATSFAIEKEVFLASFEALLNDPNAHFSIAEVEKRVVGYVLAFSHHTFYANGRVAWVEEIMVDANYRRRGMGKSLMKSVEEWAANQGCKVVALATRRAANFYEAIDYQVSATYFRKLI